MPIKPIFASVAQAKQRIENLSVDQLKAELQQGAALLLVDIRELQERVDLGTLPGAVHVPRGMLEFWADPASPYYRDYFTEHRRIIVFCAGGGRSALAAVALQEMGFTDVAHLEAGFGGWQKAGEPIEEVKSTSRWVRRDAPQT
jgi:rhodanese-related sulfurtransferase